jgi:tetratricopeptide (TPR) repeat protein
MKAESLLQKAEVLLSNKKYKEAVDTLNQAIELHDEEGELFIYRGYASYCASVKPDEAKRKQCIQEIQRGLKMRENRIANGFLFLGRIYRSADNTKNATINFKKALSLDSNNIEASRELRLLEMRNNSNKKGFWKR